MKLEQLTLERFLGTTATAYMLALIVILLLAIFVFVASPPKARKATS